MGDYGSQFAATGPLPRTLIDRDANRLKTVLGQQPLDLGLGCTAYSIHVGFYCGGDPDCAT